MKASDGDGSDVENDVNTFKHIEEDQRNGRDNNTKHKIILRHSIHVNFQNAKNTILKL